MADETNPCPNCLRQHARGPYQKRTDIDPPKVCYCPPDVDCPCGAVLRYTVPIFFLGNGWEWRIVKPAGTP